MDEICMLRRRFARLSSLALTFTLALSLLSTTATAQTPGPAPTDVTPAPAPPVPTSLPGAAPAPAPAPTLTPPPQATPVAAPPSPPSPPTKEQLAEAKKFFDNGKKLSKEGLYQEALASFLEANRIAPRASIQNELARTYRFMKDLASAYDAYATLLSSYGDQMKAAQKNDAQAALNELEALTGVVTVGVQEPGAHVLVDQKEIGETPIAKPIRLNIGMHAVVITKDGFDTLTIPAEIKGHDSIPVPGPLVKTVTTGHVAVDVKQTTPPDPTVLIYVDTSDAGAPPYAGDLEPGMHTFEAKGDKAAAPPKQIQVEKKGTYTETLELHVKAGTIVVNVDAPDTEISIDGKVVAHGVYEGPADAGTHALTVTKAGYVPYKKDLIVDDGQRAVENVPLQKEAAVAAGPAAPAARDYSGTYSQLALVGLFDVGTPTNDIAQGIGYTPSTPISTSGVYGGALNIKIGYSFGFIGIEGSILLGYDHSETFINMAAGQATKTHPGATPRTEDFAFNRVGGTITLGARVMPKMQVFRPTFGIGGGLSMKGIFYLRSEGNLPEEDSSIPSLPSNPAFYFVPALVMDGGIEIGSTPGTKFYLGCMMVADFSSTGTGNMTSSGSTLATVNAAASQLGYPAAPTNVAGANGTDIFVGPILGLQFGD